MSSWVFFPVVEKIWFQLIQTMEDFIWLGVLLSFLGIHS